MDTGGGVGRRRRLRQSSSSVVMVCWCLVLLVVGGGGGRSVVFVGLRLNFPAKNVELEEVKVGNWKLEVGG
jgi:hypothetical protein